MVGLLMALMAIGLIALVLTTGVNYVPVNALTDRENTAYLESGITSLSVGVTAYKQAKGSMPDAASWEAEVTPRFAHLPPPPSGLSWSLNNESTGTWICLSGDMSESIYKAADKLHLRMPSGVYFLNSGCGATSNMGTPGSFPETAAITYWITGP